MKSDDALHPVTGVILMVAITVILAAVIAAFAFGAAGQIRQSPQQVAPTHTTIANPSYVQKIVDVKAEHVGDAVIVVYTGGEDAADLVSFKSRINNDNSPDHELTIIPGSTATWSGDDVFPGTMNRVVVIAEFNTGLRRVVLDVYV